MSDGLAAVIAKLRADMNAEFDGVHDELEDVQNRLRNLEAKRPIAGNFVQNRPARRRQKRSKRKPVT